MADNWTRFESSLQNALCEHPDAFDLLQRDYQQPHSELRLVSEDGTTIPDRSEYFQHHLEWMIRSREQLRHLRRRIELLRAEVLISLDIVSEQSNTWRHRGEAVASWIHPAHSMDERYKVPIAAIRSDSAEIAKFAKFYDDVALMLVDLKTRLAEEYKALQRFQQQCERTSTLPEKSTDQAPPPSLVKEGRYRQEVESIEYFWTAADLIREREWWTFTAKTECKSNPNRAFFHALAERCSLNRGGSLNAQTPLLVLQSAGWIDPHDVLSSIISKITRIGETVAGS